MSKLNLPDIGSLANSASARQAINDNFAAIEEAFDNTLSRDGTLPNQMEADIDLNDNDLLNVKRIDASEYYKDGVLWEQSVAYGDVIYDKFSGNGSQTDFVLSEHPGSLGNLDVSVEGVTQRPENDYFIDGATLKFIVAPVPGTENILVRFARAVATGITIADNISYTPPQDGVPTNIKTFLNRLWSTTVNYGSALIRFIQSGTGATARTVEEKLREVELSITDFGADPTGIVACDAAWAAAQAALPLTGGTITFPRGTFRFTDTMRIGNRLPSLPSTLNGVHVRGAGRGRSAQTMNASDGATRLLYDGPSDNRPFIYIDGPISGVTFEEFFLDCNGKNVVPIRCMRSFHETVRNILGVNWCNNFSVEIGASTPNVGYGGAAPIGGLWEKVEFQSPGVGAHGVDISNGNGNVNQLRFHRCYFDRYLDNNTIGLRLGYCDHVTFDACHLAMTGGSGNTGIGVMVRAQPGFVNFPWNCTFHATTINGGCTYDNTLATWANASYPACIFEPYYTADGSPVPPKTANGGIDAPHFMFRGTTDNGVKFGWGAEEFATSVATAATIAPQTRVIQLTGTGVITNITVPHPAFSGSNGIFRLTVIPTSAGPQSLATGGNIAQNYSITNLKAFDLIYSEGTGFWSLVE